MTVNADDPATHNASNRPDAHYRRRKFVADLLDTYTWLARLQLVVLALAIGTYAARPTAYLGLMLVILLASLIACGLTWGRVFDVKVAIDKIHRGPDDGGSSALIHHVSNTPISSPHASHGSGLMTIMREIRSIRAFYALLVGLQGTLLDSSIQLYTRWPDRAHLVLTFVVGWLLLVCSLTLLRLHVKEHGIQHAAPAKPTQNPTTPCP